MSPSSPILVLDSGLGGLTVVRALRATLPHEQVLYFGDTARLPYGSKTAATVTTFVKQIIGHLRPFHPKHVVIACNTASALALPGIRGDFPELTITGVIEPGAKAAITAAGAKQFPVIGIIATEATIRSKAYDHAIHRRRNHAHLLLQPTPLLVPIIEDGRKPDDPLVKLALKQYLGPLVQRGIDVLVLGCTHYPILKDLICRLVGPKVRVIDSAEQCAEDVARRLTAKGLLRSGVGEVLPGSTGGSLRCFVTDDPARFARLGSRFLGVEIEPPTWVSPDELYATVNATVPPVRRAV
ncbi:MAG: glutamate racemase [Tepidisphaeraceae bacterium]